MKHRIKGWVFFLLTFAVSFFLFSFVSHAEVDTSVRVYRRGDEFVLSEYRADGETPLAEGTLTEVTDALREYARASSDTVHVTLEGIEADTTLTLAGGTYHLAGELTFLGDAKLVIDGACVTLGDLSLSFGRENVPSTGYVRVKSGTLVIDGATVRAGDRYAVLLDYAAGAELSVKSGSVRSSSSYATVHAATGTVCIMGGEIENTGGHAVYSASTLLLGATPTLRGVDADILTEGPIFLTANGTPFGAQVRVRYRRLFEKGVPQAVAYCAEEGMVSRITLYDRDGELMPLTYMAQASFTDEENILSVYRPYTVRYMAGGSCLSEQSALRDEQVIAPTAPTVDGYIFFGWCLDEAGTVPFTGHITEDTTVYAVYRLAPPEYRLSSMAFSYDGKRRTLAFDLLTHPLCEQGVFTYAWYKDGEAIDCALPYVPLQTVADGGIYTCEVTLTVGRDRVTMRTAEVAVTVSPQKVAPPEIAAVPYTATQQTATVRPSAFYTVTSNDGGVQVGEYPLVLELTDPANTVWEGTLDSSPLTLTFSILRAQNAFTESPTVTDVFLGHDASVSFATLFGDGVCLFSRQEQGDYTEAPPAQGGTWYVRVSVAETENYMGLLSEPLAFSVFDVVPSALQLIRSPDVTDYTAFDTFSPIGMEILCVMNDGTRFPLSIDELGVSYTDGRAYLSTADAFVFITYEGLTLPIGVNVRPAAYPMNGVTLASQEVVFCGSKQTLSLSGTLPIGLDGSSPSVVLEGGGCTVGQYTVTARFTSGSREYSDPDPLTGQLTVTPLGITVSWSSTELVYTGAYQAPTASAYDLDGLPIPLRVSGAACFAGDSYEAYCTLTDENYVILNPSVTFSIHKAVYDLSQVHWSADRFVYDGTVHTVDVLGLPEGVTVLGYTDAAAREAGSYRAGCTLAYDSRNFEEPVIPSHTYEIVRGSYDMSTVTFSPTVHIYNGSMQYPELTGRLPIGADGSVPTVSMSDGATHVAEGVIAVTVSFHSVSDNYEDPPPVQTTVTIAPRAVEVVWGVGTFVYDGGAHQPTAYADEVSVLVSGGRVDVGSYVATAYTENTDYTVTNAKCEYRIEPADNAWLLPLRVDDLIEGGEVHLEAEALVGSVEVLFFADATLTEAVDAPEEPGVYYAVARVVGEKNYRDLVGESVAFTVIKRAVTALDVTLGERELFAFDTLSLSDLFAALVYNDGSREAVPSELVTVTYESADCLLASDTSVTFGYGGLICTTPVTVERIPLATPTLPDGIFSGEEQCATVPTDAPYEIRTSVGGREVGSYAVTLVLRDPQNYRFAEGEGETLVVAFTIKPRPITVTVDDVYLYLDTKEPTFSYRLTEGELVEGEDPALTFSVQDGRIVAHADNASYDVTFCLGRVHSVLSLSSESRVTVFFILLALLALSLLAVLTHRLLRQRRLRRYVSLCFAPIAPPASTAPHTRALPTCSDGQEECEDATLDDAEAYDEDSTDIASCDAEEIYDEDSTDIASCDAEEIYDEDSTDTALCEDGEVRAQTDESTPSFEDIPVRPAPADEEDELTTPLLESAQDALICAFTSVDVRRADMLISDSLATQLLTELPQVIETFGHRRVVLNVDALNEVFSSGERVDVNVLKDRYLIPYDAGYLKILADGSLDKALEVYADGFSMQAIKMIALTGGRAIRVRTVSVADPKKKKKTGKSRKKH